MGLHDALEASYLVNIIAVLFILITTLAILRKIISARYYFYIYWIIACLLWVTYYSLMYFGIIQYSNPSKNPPTISIQTLMMMSLNFLNSFFIFLAAVFLDTQYAEQLDGRTTARIVLLSIVGIEIIALLITLLWFGLCGVSNLFTESGWYSASLFANSITSGAVLIYFYRRLLLYFYISSRASGLALVAFFAYAYLQAWYPYVMGPVVSEGPGHKISVVVGIYLAAAILKILCTSISLYHAAYSTHKAYYYA